MRGYAVVILVLCVLVVTAGITLTVVVLVWPGCNQSKLQPKPTPEDDLWMEQWRPVYHYTPFRNWINDPNGLLYYKGEYHMFYQYSTHSAKHENISWGHAISTDLIRWVEYPPAIFADGSEEIFSGSAIVDKDNISKLGTLQTPAMLAYYTGYRKTEPHYQYQSLAHSTDLGRTWTKYRKNPLIDIHEEEFRDPKVIRVSDGWIMLVQRSDLHYLQFYKSTDLLSWTKVGQFPAEGDSRGAVGGVWECPDLFPLPVDNNKSNIKWVLIVNINPGNKYDAGSGVQYFIGEFNGTSFIPDDKKIRWLDHGMDFYAAVSFADVPDDKRVIIGWMSNWLYSDKVPTSPWTNGMSIARELQLQTINGALTLTQKPAQNLLSLRRGPLLQGSGITIDDKNYETANMKGRALDIEATFTRLSATKFGIKVHASEDHVTLVGFERIEDGFLVYIDRRKSGLLTDVDGFTKQVHHAPIHADDQGKLYMRVLVDSCSVEVFAGDGEAVITDLVFPSQSGHGVSFFSKGGAITIDEFQMWHMDTILPD